LALWKVTFPRIGRIKTIHNPTPNTMNVKCTSCGAQQDLAATGNCSYCGNTIELSQGQAAYTTMMQGEVGNLIVMAETAVDAGNWEEALQYYNRILEKQITNSDAWLGKGIAMVNTSTIGTMKVTEAIAYWKNAVKNAPDQVAMGKRVAKEIDRVVQGFYPVLENHYVQFRTMDNSYPELVGRFSQLEKAQEQAVSLDEGNIQLHMTGYELCNKVIEMPLKYSSMDKTAAAVDAIGGALSGSKYAKNDAISKHRNAQELESLIMNTALEVVKIQHKYINGIKRINPGFVLSQSSNNITNRLEKIKGKEAGKKKFRKAVLFYLGSFFLMMPVAQAIAGETNPPGFFILIILIVPFIIGYIGYNAD
jgi:tetratricopeptide (TPR) repeat protein